MTTAVSHCRGLGARAQLNHRPASIVCHEQLARVPPNAGQSGDLCFAFSLSPFFLFPYLSQATRGGKLVLIKWLQSSLNSICSMHCSEAQNKGKNGSKDTKRRSHAGAPFSLLTPKSAGSELCRCLSAAPGELSDGHNCH